jgi:hypothetical protein
MNPRLYSWIAGFIFSVFAVFQLARAVVGVSITIGNISVPLSVSWGACVFAVILAWLGFRASRA